MGDALFLQLRADLAQALLPEEFHEAQGRALDVFDLLSADFVAQSAVDLACRDGCSLCCSLRVDVFAHEVWQIARHVLDHFTPGALDELRARLKKHAGQVLAIDAFTHATQNMVCPLLQSGSCSVYAVRPQACRRHHSTDFAACQFTYDHPTDLDFPGAHHRPLFLALSEALQSSGQVYADGGYDSTVYELGTALEEALNDPAAWVRWQEKRPAFLASSVTPTS
jgi:Fe-S-cluster containining protein